MDWKNPDYTPIFAERVERLKRIRADPAILPALKVYYRDNPAQFINDWGCTTDPRNLEIGLPAIIPFILFPRQVEFVDWVMDSWHNRRPGVAPKSRESGMSWIALALSCTLCLFNHGMTIGFGSRKEEYVDLVGAPKSLFWKARKFIELLPPEFRNGFNPKTDAPHMRIMFHQTGSIISGEAGDNIGRGDRAAIYWVDESAFVERPQLIEQSLSQTTNCRIDISTANGTGNPFHRKVVEWPPERVFRFHWRDDPRKDQAWYDKQLDELDSVTIAQELDIDFAASVEGVLIPSAWVQSAIDAHIRLGITPTGKMRGAFDVADQGRDKCAFVAGRGIVLSYAKDWSGKGDDIFGSCVLAAEIADDLGIDEFDYDADGLGAGVRGDMRVINAGRPENRRKLVNPFHGSGAVLDPTKQDVPGRNNEDFFMNLKAQYWWGLRQRFQTTHRAITAPSVETAQNYDPDGIISISSEMPLEVRNRLVMELSQPTYIRSPIGKIIVDKAPDSTLSPNLADGAMILYGRPAPRGMRINRQAIAVAKRRR